MGHIGGHEGDTEATAQEFKQQPDPHSADPACNIVTSRAQKANNTLEELPFFHAELESRLVKQPKSRAQRTREKLLAMVWNQWEEAGQFNQPLDIHILLDTAASLQDDPTLKP